MIEQLEERQADMQGLLKETAKKIARLRAEAKALTPQRIRVPENIKFEECGEDFALISPHGKCYLTANRAHGGTPFMNIVGNPADITADLITDPLYLEPCKREDLKCGDVAFGTDFIKEETDFSAIDCYFVVLNKKQAVLWEHGKDMDTKIVDVNFWHYSYKVVR
jgi:hypothetical protein